MASIGSRKLSFEQLENRHLAAVDLVSRTGLGLESSTANGNSFGFFATPSGRFVLFTSEATNLVPQKIAEGSNVYLADTELGSIRLVSESSAPRSDSSYGQSRALGVSDDGRFALFRSDLNSLVFEDRNGQIDLFIRDMLTGVITRVSTDSNGRELPAATTYGSISGDGRTIAFQTSAKVLTADRNELDDIYIKNWMSGEVSLVTLGPSGESSNGKSQQPIIAASGKRVLFRSEATNLVSGDSSAGEALFLHDLASNITTRISDYSDTYAIQPNYSIDREGRFLAYARERRVYRYDVTEHLEEAISNAIEVDNGYPKMPSVYFPLDEEPIPPYVWFDAIRLSADGTKVSFTSNVDQGFSTSPGIRHFVYDFDRNRLRSILDVSSKFADASTESTWISDDGKRFIASTKHSDLVNTDRNQAADLFFGTLGSSEVSLITRVAPGRFDVSAGKASHSVSISADGSRIAFVSSSSNLVPDDTNEVDDVFVSDRITGRTTRISLATDGSQRNQPSRSPTISGDGRFVLFASYGYGSQQVYRKDLLTGELLLVNPRAEDENDRSYYYPLDLSYDGRFALFACDALVPGVTLPENSPDSYFGPTVVRKDLVTGELRAVNVDDSGRLINFAQFESSGNNRWMSDNGRYVVLSGYQQGENALLKNGVYFRDLETGATKLLNVSSTGVRADNFTGAPAISPDGSTVAFASAATNLGDISTQHLRLLVVDVASGVMRAIKGGRFTQGGFSWVGLDAEIFSLSHDGSKIGFINFNKVAYVYDLKTDEVQSMSMDSVEGYANGGIMSLDMSSDGTVVAFCSSATNLYPGTNGTNVFISRFGVRPITTPDQVVTRSRQTVVIDALANDSLPGPARSFDCIAELVSLPPIDHGTVSIDSSQRFVFTPGLSFHGKTFFQYRIRDSQGNYSCPETITVEVAPVPYRKFSNSTAQEPGSQVTVSYVDAYAIVDELNRNGFRSLIGAPASDFYWDTNDDQIISPIDALFVANYLNRMNRAERQDQQLLPKELQTQSVTRTIAIAPGFTFAESNVPIDEEETAFSFPKLNGKRIENDRLSSSAAMA